MDGEDGWFKVFTDERRNARNDPNGTRTRVAGVKGRCPRPLDEGAAPSKAHRSDLPDEVRLLRLDEDRQGDFAETGAKPAS